MTLPFKAKRVTRDAVLTLGAPPEQVFGLLGPVREAEWAEGWQPDLIYSEAPLGEEQGAVFITHQPGEAETIWMVSQYDAAQRRIEYVRVTPGSRVARIIIQCDAGPNGTTRAQVTYQFTALSEAGNRFVEGFSQEHYQHMMASWQAAISHTLATGGRMSHHP